MRLGRSTLYRWSPTSNDTGTLSRGVPVPKLFWPAFAVVMILHTLGSQLSSGLALAVAAGLMLLGGLPHGAFDIALAREALRLNHAAVIALLFGYISITLVMLALWSWAPLVALAVFLMLSAVHFGED